MKKYFLISGTEQQGPFDIEELKSRNISLDNPVWYEGIKEWTTIGNVPELKSIFQIVPPPYTTQVKPPASVQKPIDQQKTRANKPKGISSLGLWLLIIGGVIVLGLLAVLIYTQIESQNRQNSINTEEDNKTVIRNNITSYVTAENNEYVYNELGGIFNLKITVTNSTDYLLDNVKVKISYIKATGDIWDTRVVDFDMIEAHSKMTKKIPDTQRGTSINYDIISIKSNTLGLY